MRGSRKVRGVTDEAKIVTHSEPVGRARTNYIHRLDVDVPRRAGLDWEWGDPQPS